MGLLNLVVDRQNKRLVAVLGSITQIPPIFQSNTVTVRVTVVDPTGSLTAPYTTVDLTGYGCRVSVGATPTGDSGGPAPLALQDTNPWVPAGKYFQGDLALNTVAVDSYIGTTASKSAFFEINLTNGGTRETILQVTFTLAAVVDELTSTTPTPTDQFLTKAECLALFQKLIGDAGQRLVLKSLNGVYGREIGVNDDGSAMDNIIVL